MFTFRSVATHKILCRFVNFSPLRKAISYWLAAVTAGYLPPAAHALSQPHHALNAADIKVSIADYKNGLAISKLPSFASLTPEKLLSEYCR